MKQHLAVLAAVLSLTTTCLSQQPRHAVDGQYLLKTKWGGAAPFNSFAPDGSTLGCHSTAAAQVLYYHRLAPHGRTSYRCSSGIGISEVFSAATPQWHEFALDLDSAQSDAPGTRNASRFIYDVATIIRKDFGSDQYVDYANDYHKKAIEAHFHCTVTGYSKEVTSTIAEALRRQPDFHSLLKKEIRSGRPAVFYYTDRKGGGHGVVIDGHTVKGGKAYFHVNFGWFGSSDGWYLLEEDLPRNTKEVLLITIAPEDIEQQDKNGS